MKVVISSPVEHDGKALKVGGEIDLPKEAAEALVALGAAEVPAGRKAKAEEPKPEGGA